MTMTAAPTCKFPSIRTRFYVGLMLALLATCALPSAMGQTPRGSYAPRTRTASGPMEMPVESEEVCGPSADCFDLADDPCWRWACEGRLWCELDYLLWWTRASNAPPLVTTSLDGTPPETAGVIGLSTTRVLFGGDDLSSGVHPGGRVRLGLWLDPCESAGFEASYLGLADRRASFTAASPATPILARPYLDLQTNQQDAMLVAHPDFLDGSLNALVETGWQTVEVAYRQAFWRQCERRADWLVGYRYASLDEHFEVSQTSRFTVARPPILAGTRKDVFDTFAGQNEFHGGELGLIYQDTHGRWTGELMLKIALGGTRGRVDVQGRTVTVVPVPGGGISTAEFDGGLLAQTTNAGQHVQDGFAVLPELGVKFGYEITPQLQLTVGYGLFVWTRVMRPVDQIDLSMSQLPPEPPTDARQPQFPFSTTSFWAQGLQFGLAYAF